MDPATAPFPPSTHLPTLHEVLAPFGISFSKAAPANITVFVALLAGIFVWFLIWRTRLGYQIRAFGESDSAAKYAGISPVRITVITMLISGALAGLMSINTTLGEAERLILNAPEGAGFIGIAVALMGRSHPLGVALASILFGFLYQGGAELAMWMSIPRELIIVIQALVILFTGALDNMVRMPIEALFRTMRRSGGKR
jgi:simple sugar transport system permease protein